MAVALLICIFPKYSIVMTRLLHFSSSGTILTLISCNLFYISSPLCVHSVFPIMHDLCNTNKNSRIIIRQIIREASGWRHSMKKVADVLLRLNI